MGQAFLESDENIVVSHITWHSMYIAKLSIQKFILQDFRGALVETNEIPNDTEGDASVSHKIAPVIRVEVQTRDQLQDQTKRQHTFVQHFLTLAELKVAP